MVIVIVIEAKRCDQRGDTPGHQQPNDAAQAHKELPTRSETEAGSGSCVAPTALRNPTSKVLSVTLTSMMFITTMPPTTRVIRVIGTTTSGDAAGKLIDLIVELFDIHDAKVVFFIPFKPVLDSQRHARIFNRRLKVSRSSALAVNLQDRCVRRSACAS